MFHRIAVGTVLAIQEFSARSEAARSDHRASNQGSSMSRTTLRTSLLSTLALGLLSLGAACDPDTMDTADTADTAALDAEAPDLEGDDQVGLDDGAEHDRLSPNARKAVVLEAFYALDKAYTGSSTKSVTSGGGTWTASDWNYLNSDTGAYSTMSGRYGAYTSTYYGTSPSSWGQTTSGYGRGGQCKFFANLLLYRSGTDSSTFPTYAAWSKAKSARCAQKGDVIFRTSGGATGHVAVVVDILSGSSSSCTVSSVDVVDSNMLGDERILRHIINTSGSYLGEDLDNYYVHTGVSYYATAYGDY